MNAITPVQQPLDAVAWDEATTAVNAWRGQALHWFAKAEAAVSETLVLLDSMPERDGAKVRLRHLVGQRFEDLASAIDGGGPFGAEGLKAAPALAAFRQYDSLRPFLCHGLAKVALDRNGHWLVVLKQLALAGGKAKRSSIAYGKSEAEALLDELKQASRQLASALQSLRARIGQ